MANYANEVWSAAQYKLNGLITAPEFKVKPSAALLVFLANTNFLIPASERERMWMQKPSDSTTVYLNSLNKQSISTGSARAHNHSGSNNDGTRTTASYTITSAAFLYSLKTGGKNVFQLAEIIAAQIRSAAIAMHQDIETDLITALGTNKSQVVVSLTPQSGTWDASNYILGVAQANKDQYFQYLKMFMLEQYYRGNFYLINNILAQAKYDYLAMQGAGNNTNLGWQIAGLQGFGTTELSNSSGYDMMSYILPEGSVGVLPWIPMINRTGHGADPFVVGGQYSTIPDPLGTGLTFAVHQYAAGADNSSTFGETQDVNVYVELSVDLAPIVAPMSTANLSPVFLAGLLT